MNRRKSRASIFFGVGGRRTKISINAVCSLNIKAEPKYRINLINQFNGIVDKLNAEREKEPLYDLNENGRDNGNVKYYEFYKDKTQSNFLKNLEISNKNYTNEKNNEFNFNNNKNERKNNNISNNYYKRNNANTSRFIRKNGYGNMNYNDNILKFPKKFSTNKIRNYRDKIYKYSSNIVFPSNKMVHE